MGTVRRDERRARVFAAALAAAAESAPGPVKVTDIATRAGMSAGHVMYYFGDRDRIVVETLLDAERTLAATRDRRVARAGDARAALEVLVRLYLPTGRSDGRWRLWAQLLAHAPEDTATRVAVEQVIDGWTHALESVIRRGVDERLSVCPDPARTAYDLCRLMDGYALEQLLGRRGATRTWAVNAVLGTADQLLHVASTERRE